MVILFVLMALFVQTGIAASPVENYINEKADYASAQDVGEYEGFNADVYLVFDGENFLVAIDNGKVTEVKMGIPDEYDYKITTTRERADQWWEIALYYFENQELTWKQRYIDIPWLFLNTPIVCDDDSNFAAMVQNAKESVINLV